MNNDAVGAGDAQQGTSATDKEMEHRVRKYVAGSDFTWVSAILSEYRNLILERWLEVAAEQPFHTNRREHVVADHIPRLFDALVDLLATTSVHWTNAISSIDHSAFSEAAQNHARTRAEQGLQPADVVVEFRLLRQEIWRALRAHVPEDAPVDDVVGAELMVNDALDGAISLGLNALTQRIDQLREEFLATTVHEVRQPLTSIVGHAQLADHFLNKEPPDLDSAHRSLERIRDASGRMTALLATLSDISRIALDQLDLRISNVDLLGLVEDVVSESETSEGARVKVACTPGLTTTGEWDGPRLQQVVSNLLSNAIKYSPASTPIEISLRGDEAQLTLEVRDHGMGIDPADLPTIFGRYMRTSDAKAERVDGLGLGLYLSKGIVEAHHGEIHAESDGAGLGTAFILTLPRHALPASDEVETAVEP